MEKYTRYHMNRIPEGTKAMIFAAGLGTRLKPFTERHPKALAPVNGKPLLQRNIEYMSSYGIKDLIVNVHHFADQIIDFLQSNKSFGLNIDISHEIEGPLETGGGLQHAKWYFENSDKPFFVMNADILTKLDLQAMYDYHVTKKGIATLAVTKRNSSRNFLFDNDQLLTGWENSLTGEQKIARQANCMHKAAFTCVHVIEPRMIDIIRQEGKFSIIDAYLDLAKTEPIYVYDHTGDVVVDVGKPESIAKAEAHFK